MKATQSSLYRELENLMLWFIPVGNNIPKDFALRKLGERMQNDILDAMTACNLALQTQDLHQRMELISLVKLHLPFRRIQTGEAEKQVSAGNGFSKKEY